MCNACRLPITDEDKASEHFEKGVSCPKCVDKHSDEQKARFRERENEFNCRMLVAETHVGGVLLTLSINVRREACTQEQQRSGKKAK